MNRNLYTDAIADDHIYVREEGRLTVKSNYVWEGSFRNAERLLSWRIAGGEQGNKVLSIATVSLKDGGLYMMCLKYIARHIELLDSLVNFPELIGKRLLHVLKDEGILDHYGKSKRALNIFSDAYGSLLLDALSIRCCPYVIDDKLDELMAFSALVEVDLSDNKLGDDHDILIHIWKIESLKKLVLKNNCITDRGISKMTTPYRVMKVGSRRLSTLDLSVNRITSSSLKYLAAFKCLEMLNLSDNNIQENKEFQNFLNLSDLKKSAIRTEYTEVRNNGWCKQVIEDWIHQAQAYLITKAESQVTTLFYNQEHKRNQKNTDRQSEKKGAFTNLYLVGNREMSIHQEKIGERLKDRADKCFKTQVEGNPISTSCSYESVSCLARPAKKPRYSAFSEDNDEDIDWFQSYL